MKKSVTGFTIVELVLVIVVIAILASITIVAYSGISEKARLAAGAAFEHEIRGKYASDAMGAWSMDDCSGTTVKNTIYGSAVSDPITGTATWITDTPSGKGCALRLNGSTEIETLASLGSTYYVKGVWVRMSSGTCGAGSNNILSQATTNGAEAVLYAPSCKPSAGHNGSWATVKSPTAINDGKWHYIAVIWENNILTLYIDSKSVSSTSGVSAPTNSSGATSIGGYLGSYSFTGDIDNVFIAAH